MEFQVSPSYPKIPLSLAGYEIRSQTESGQKLVLYTGKSWHVARLVYNTMNQFID